LLVDIGKIGFSDELLSLSMNQMNGDQLGIFHKHTIRAEQVLMPLEDLQSTAKILRSQHERVDGKGFPDQLSGDQIPIGAQILSVASDYDNLQNGSFLQRRVPVEEAQDLIIRGAGIRYNPKVTNAFKDVLHHTQSEEFDYHEVSVYNLQAGMVLAADLMSKEGTLLLPSNYLLTAGIIEKIKLFNVSHGATLHLKIRNKEKS
jgi:HD-GYP domain-containing protein (c-di-GMP phosphodiesterase class II)